MGGGRKLTLCMGVELDLGKKAHDACTFLGYVLSKHGVIWVKWYTHSQSKFTLRLPIWVKLKWRMLRRSNVGQQLVELSIYINQWNSLFGVDFSMLMREARLSRVRPVVCARGVFSSSSNSIVGLRRRRRGPVLTYVVEEATEDLCWEEDSEEVGCKCCPPLPSGSNGEV